MEFSPDLTICMKYCCSRFHTYLDTEPTRPAGLTNDILPLLLPARFVSSIDYTMLEPSLRLASQLLTSGGAAFWLVTMVDGDMHLAHAAGQGARLRPSELDNMRDSSGNAIFPLLARYPAQDHFQDVEKTKARAIEILQNLSCMIDIGFANLPPDVRGYGKAVEGPLTFEMLLSWPRGVRSQIFVAADKYFDIVKLTALQRQDLLSNKELERLLLTQFSYATTLVHEIGHALHCAVQGSIHRGEPFFRDCKIAEGGYDLEAAIFGGLLDGNITMTTRQYAKNVGLCRQAKQRVQQGKYAKNVLTLTKWPSGVYQQSYHAGHKVMTCRMELPPVDEVARVPLSFIRDLFSMQFWEADKSRDTLECLHVSTQGNWFVGVDAASDRQFVCDLDDPCIDEHTRARLLDMINKRIEPTSSDSSAVPTSPHVKLKRHPRRSRRLVAIFGDELRQVVQLAVQGKWKAS